MFDDIKKPHNWNPHTGKRNPMRSLRLRGQSMDYARERLLGAEQKPTPQPGPHLPAQASEVSAVSEKQKQYKHSFWHHWSKGRKLIVGAISLLFVISISTGLFLTFFHKQPPPKKVVLQVHAEPPKPTTVPSPLSGIAVSPELAARPVTGIMIENSPDSRPQSGLQDAGIVFEAVAEGGITRFLTLYQDTQPQYIGPVRSLRPYYIDWAAPFDAGIAHVGGSPDALAQIRSSGKDLDQFFNAGSYWREPSRAAPHNVYTSFEKLDSLNKSKGYTSSKFNSWPRKDDKPLVTPIAKAIDLNISSTLFNVHYDYDKASNTYFRFEGGASHKFVISSGDTTGGQLHPKVVIVLVMGYSIAGDRIHSQYSVNGSGPAFIFQDGGVTQGTWNKSDRPSQFTFTDANSQPIKLNAGQTWVSAVSSADKVLYKP